MNYDDYEITMGNMDMVGCTFEMIDEGANAWDNDNRYGFSHDDDYQWGSTDWDDDWS